MIKFLLDANLSHETRDFLNKLGYEAYTVAQFDLQREDDLIIAQFAIKNHLTILTLDTDFGYIYHQAQEGEKPSIVVIGLEDQTIESVNDFLVNLHSKDLFTIQNLRETLVIAEKNRLRIRKF